MKTLFKYLIVLLFTGIVISSNPTFGQSALGQLENMAGQKVSVPKASAAASLNNMVAGAVVQSLLNSLFSTPTVSKEELAAQQKAAELAAQQAAEQAAEQQRIKEEIAQAEHDKMMQSFKQLDGSQDLGMKTLDNNGLNSKTFDRGNAVPIMRSQKEANVEEYFRTHFLPVSSNNELDESNFKYEPIPFYTKALLQQEQHLIIVGGGLLVKAVSAGTLAKVVSWGSPVLEEGILKPLEDCFSGDCPTKGKIFENVLKGSKSNIIAPYVEKLGEAGGAMAAATVGGDVSKYSKFAGKSFGVIYDVADTGKDLYDSGLKEIWGSVSGKDAADAFRKADQMRKMTH